MLVLTRRQGESLLIGNDNKITVCIIYKTQIKLELNDSKVVTIKLQESISIRDGIKISVEEIKKSQVNLVIISTNLDPDFCIERLLRYVPDGRLCYGQGPQLFCRP